MISCVVVDDEPIAADGLKSYIKQTPFLKFVRAFNSAIKAIDFLQETEVDLLLLDIQMPEINGIELLKSLSNPPKVIFTTAYRKYAFEGFQLDAVDYLLKPIDYKRFLKSINKVLLYNTKDDYNEAIFIKCDGIITKVIISDILYAETAKDYVIIYTDKRKYMSLFSLKQLEAFLPTNQFYRVHRSYFVNLKKVDKIEGSLLHIGPYKIPCSRTSKDFVTSLILGNRFIQR
ncbi:LytR/AlgR family response regulator transcription factor [Maribacter sp. IgM3_T14_3]|uniref:LytR/AlgR family response regulator transcription factor n=1 Tax=Maribacter sp. IgM3_T14_3 TaxID=3415140 RepID=UPI003C6FAE54